MFNFDGWQIKNLDLWLVLFFYFLIGGDANDIDGEAVIIRYALSRLATHAHLLTHLIKTIEVEEEQRLRTAIEKSVTIATLQLSALIFLLVMTHAIRWWNRIFDVETWFGVPRQREWHCGQLMSTGGLRRDDTLTRQYANGQTWRFKIVFVLCMTLG